MELQFLFCRWGCQKLCKQREWENGFYCSPDLLLLDGVVQCADQSCTNACIKNDLHEHTSIEACPVHQVHDAVIGIPRYGRAIENEELA